MSFLIRLKHWQLFLLTWGVAILITIVSFTSEDLIFQLFPLMMVILTIGFFGWIWAICTELHSKLPAGVPLPLFTFKILIAIPAIYSFVVTAWITFITIAGGPTMDYSFGIIIGILLLLHLTSMVCIVMGIRFAAKTLKSVELGRHARFSDYINEFFLIWFSFIGVWILQPRLNKLTDEK